MKQQKSEKHELQANLTYPHTAWRISQTGASQCLSKGCDKFAPFCFIRDDGALIKAKGNQMTELTSEMKETLRTLEIYLRGESVQKKAPRETTQASESCDEKAAVSKLRLTAHFLSEQPTWEVRKSCLLRKRSEVQQKCASSKLDFAAVERMAVEALPESAKTFYRACVEDQR